MEDVSWLNIEYNVELHSFIAVVKVKAVKSTYLENTYT